jgi:SAM-dependent methyltransferase
MLDGLVKRARRKGVDNVIEARLCSQDGLGLDDLAGTAELVIAIHVVHETTYPQRLLAECAAALQPGGRLLIAEPRGHVSEAEFAETTGFVESLGMAGQTVPAIRKSWTAVFEKP